MDNRDLSSLALSVSGGVGRTKEIVVPGEVASCLSSSALVFKVLQALVYAALRANMATTLKMCGGLCHNLQVV